MHHGRMIALATGLALTVCVPAVAQDAEPENRTKLDLTEILSKMGDSISIPSMSENKLPPFKTVTKGMEASKGLFTLWSYPKGARNKDTETLLCQIPNSSLGKKFMLSTSIAGGGFFTGFPLDERCVYWQVKGDQMILMEPQSGYVIDRSKAVSDAVKRTYPDRIRVAVRMATRAPNGDPVIDLGSLLKSNFADIGWMSGGFSFFGGGGGGSINASLSKWSRKPKAFPQNVEVGVELAVSSHSPPGSYTKTLVHYSFWALPSTGYKPRVADDRVGYFLTANQDWGKPSSSRDIFNRYVDRWQLEKRDPSLAVCEPKQPIIFYIEKTVPVRYRRAVRDGIAEWNKAYEQIGFLNAIEVRQQTSDNEWKDLDPEDMRYSFFRWIVTGAGFAMGPHRSNPFTGQIYDADIIFDDAMVRYYEQSAANLLPHAMSQRKAEDPVLQRFFQENPSWQRPERLWERSPVAEKEQMESDALAAARQRLKRRGRNLCDYADGMKHQMSLGRTLLAGKGKAATEEFLYDVVKEVVMHEVGHTLGLRHNFAASSIYTLEQIKERRTKGQPTVGSVMDYNPVLFFKEKLPKTPARGHFVTGTLGPYDEWAIEYGYRPYDGKYKSPVAKAPGTKDEEGEAARGEAAPEHSSAPRTPEIPEGMAKMMGSVKLEDIPPEILAMMPPEARKMLENGGLQKMLESMGGAEDGLPVPMPLGPSGPSGPSFSSAPSGELGMLLQIASRAAEPELAYATDEDTSFLAPDPRANRFDMGKDPLEWALTRAELVDDRMEKILDWAVDEKESWYHLRNAYQTLIFEKIRVIDFVGRLIGGQEFNRYHKGDVKDQAPFELVPAATQRRALAFIQEHVFSDSFLKIDAKVLNHLAPSRWSHRGSWGVDYVMDFPIHDLAGVIQWWVLFDRLYPNTLRRLHDNELKTDAKDKLTVAEYLQSVQSSVWDNAGDLARLQGKAWTNADPFLSDMRRSLQREYLGLVEPLVRRKPGQTLSPDLHAMIQYSLKLLSRDLGKVLDAGKADFASQAHLDACKSRIDRMLSPELEEIQPQPSFFFFGREAGKERSK